MGLFDRKPPAPPQVKESKYTVDKVAVLLDQFGPLRLEVTDVALKVLIQRISWGVMPYLTTTTNGPPDIALLADTITTLEMLVKTLQAYITIQNDPQHDAEDMLERGYRAIEVYAEKITAPPSTSVERLSYTALTDHLTGNHSL